MCTTFLLRVKLGSSRGGLSRQTMSSSLAAPMPESIGPPVSCFSSHPLRSSTMFSLHSQWIRRTATYMRFFPRDITFSSRCQRSGGTLVASRGGQCCACDHRDISLDRRTCRHGGRRLLCDDSFQLE